MTINVIEKTAPFTGGYSCVTYNNIIYINTTDKIYTYDATNNIYTLKLTKTTASSYNYCALYSGKLYMMRINAPNSSTSTQIYIDAYDIESNTITYGITMSSLYNYCYNYTLSDMNIIDDNISMYLTGSWGQYSLRSYYYIIQYNITKNQLTATNSGSGEAYKPAEGQYTNNFYFGSKYGVGWSNTGWKLYYSNDYGVLTNGNFTNLGKWETTRAYASFERNGKIYILGGINRLRKLSVYDVQSSSFTDSSITLPFDISDIKCGRINNDYYIFGTNSILKISFIDYNLTYKIANKTGTQEYTQLTGQSPITQVRFNYSGTGDVGYVFNTLSGTVTGTYTPNVPSGYKLVGFGPAPNSKIALAGLNVDVSVTIDENFTFYEIYQVYKPPATTFEMDLYKNTAEINRVDKTNYLTSVGSLFGALRTECSIIRPSIIIEQETLPSFNYVYIGAFGRYYFVTGITSVAYKMWRIELNTDVLMTYKNGIALLTAIIARQENDYNDDLIDTEIPTEKEPTVIYQEIENSVLNTQETEDKHSFVLTVVGA